jgi:hypothetical protein
MGLANSDINRYLNAEMLFGNAFSQPISNFLTLYGSQPTEQDESLYYKNISRLINGSRTYKVVQL